MILHVKPGHAMIATRLGEDRRMVFITPAGCSFDKPTASPEGTDLSGAGYDVDPGPCETIISAALKAGHEGLKGQIELRDGTAAASAGSRKLSRK